MLFSGGSATDTGYGGAAGGSVYIKSPSVQITGEISVTGGNSHTSGGGGGGGLVAVEYESGYVGEVIVAYGGTGSQNGAAGVVYLYKVDQLNPFKRVCVLY